MTEQPANGRDQEQEGPEGPGGLEGARKPSVPGRSASSPAEGEEPRKPLQVMTMADAQPIRPPAEGLREETDDQLRADVDEILRPYLRDGARWMAVTALTALIERETGEAYERGRLNEQNAERDRKFALRQHERDREAQR